RFKRDLAYKGEAETRAQAASAGSLDRRPRVGAEREFTCDGGRSRLALVRSRGAAQSLAARLAAACGVNLFLKRIETDRADHDVVAHHVARGAVEAERVGELEALFDGGFDLVARHVLLEPCDVEPCILRRGECARPVRLAAPAEQLLMEVEIFLAARVLHAHRRRDLRRLYRTLAEHREFLEHEFEAPVALDEIEHVAHRAFAVAAIVVEELDHRDVALRIAQGYLPRRAEKLSTVLGDAGAMLFRFRRGLPLLELAHYVLQQLGVAQQVILDDALDLAALIAAEGLGL